mmetsp:Transcript_12348/g.31929  ORF Transcript_12348/g.31929 Transcript_12348/m.31929 type:complete len:313 (+) Transcript_12348:540-1478(+)
MPTRQQIHMVKAALWEHGPQPLRVQAPPPPIPTVLREQASPIPQLQSASRHRHCLVKQHGASDNPVTGHEQPFERIVVVYHGEPRYQRNFAQPQHLRSPPRDYLIYVRNQNDVMRLHAGHVQSVSNVVALHALRRGRTSTAPKIIPSAADPLCLVGGDDVDDLVRVSSKHIAILEIDEGLRDAGVGHVALNENKGVHDRVKLEQPHLQHVKLLEECKRIKQPPSPRRRDASVLPLPANVLTLRQRHLIIPRSLIHHVVLLAGPAAVHLFRTLAEPQRVVRHLWVLCVGRVGLVAGGVGGGMDETFGITARLA